MNFITSLFSIVPTLIGGVADHFKDKRELQRVEVEGQIQLKKAITEANIEKAKLGQTADIEWSKEMAAATKDSWKDEWFTLVLSVPAIMAFIPGLTMYVTEGFVALEQTPEWYQLALFVAIGSAFGVRLWENIQSMRKR